MSNRDSRNSSESETRNFLLGKRNLVSTGGSRRCCRSAMCFTSKAAFFSLAWSFGVNLLYDVFYKPSNYLSVLEGDLFSTSWVIAIAYAAGAIVLSFYPLAGFLADNKFGRYKEIASEASPTLGCSIEISRDIYI